MVLDLPYDFKRPKSLSYKGMSTQKIIDSEQRAKVKSMQNQIASEYIVLFSIFNILLHKLTAKRVCYWCPIAARDLKDTEDYWHVNKYTPVKIEINPDIKLGLHI